MLFGGGAVAGGSIFLKCMCAREKVDWPDGKRCFSCFRRRLNSNILKFVTKPQLKLYCMLENKLGDVFTNDICENKRNGSKAMACFFVGIYF